MSDSDEVEVRPLGWSGYNYSQMNQKETPGAFFVKKTWNLERYKKNNNYDSDADDVNESKKLIEKEDVYSPFPINPNSIEDIHTKDRHDGYHFKKARAEYEDRERSEKAREEDDANAKKTCLGRACDKFTRMLKKDKISGGRRRRTRRYKKRRSMKKRQAKRSNSRRH